MLPKKGPIYLSPPQFTIGLSRGWSEPSKLFASDEIAVDLSQISGAGGWNGFKKNGCDFYCRKKLSEILFKNYSYFREMLPYSIAFFYML